MAVSNAFPSSAKSSAVTAFAAAIAVLVVAAGCKGPPKIEPTVTVRFTDCDLERGSLLPGGELALVTRDKHHFPPHYKEIQLRSESAPEILTAALRLKGSIGDVIPLSRDLAAFVENPTDPHNLYLRDTAGEQPETPTSLKITVIPDGNVIWSRTVEEGYIVRNSLAKDREGRLFAWIERGKFRPEYADSGYLWRSRICVLDIQTREMVLDFEYPEHKSEPDFLAVSAEASLVAVKAFPSRKVTIIDLASGAVLSEAEVPAGGFPAFAQKSGLLTVGPVGNFGDGSFGIWDIESGFSERVSLLTGGERFCEDSRHFFTFRIFLLGVPVDYFPYAAGIAVSPCGRFVATEDWYGLVVYDLQDKRRLLWSEHIGLGFFASDSRGLWALRRPCEEDSRLEYYPLEPADDTDSACSD